MIQAISYVNSKEVLECELCGSPIAVGQFVYKIIDYRHKCEVCSHCYIHIENDISTFFNLLIDNLEWLKKRRNFKNV